MSNRRSVAVGLLGFVATILAFQNCSNGFKSLAIESGVLASTIDTKVVCLTADAPLISETCLGKDPVEYANLRQYIPQYPLYSDGAAKRRWIYLPDGSEINMMNQDDWEFPVGTILWKEFSLDGMRIETRKLQKISEAPGVTSWDVKVYLWKKDQSDAELVTADIAALTDLEKNKFEASEVADRYSLVAQSKCMTCHQGAKDVILGYSHFQFTDTIAGNAFDKKAIGYIQSNCATCHNSTTPAAGLNLKHVTTNTSLSQEAVIAADATNTTLIVPGLPDQSSLYTKIAGGQMPPRYAVPLKFTDPEGVQIIRDWILQFNQN